MNQIDNQSQKEELEELKKEVLNELKGKKNKKKIRWGSAVVTVILVILVLISAGQTVQSANVLNKIKSGDIQSGSTSSDSALPSSLESLPDMVGGC